VFHLAELKGNKQWTLSRDIFAKQSTALQLLFISPWPVVVQFLMLKIPAAEHFSARK
jgi:hypothetical protein